MNYIHSAHDFTIVIHLCIISCALLLGSTLRAKVHFLQKYLIPAPMIGGLFLFIFYNYIASYLNLQAGTNFLEELMFHLLNISFIAM
jgi:ESS family glutamate:Na+ symporter